MTIMKLIIAEIHLSKNTMGKISCIYFQVIKVIIVKSNILHSLLAFKETIGRCEFFGNQIFVHELIII